MADVTVSGPTGKGKTRQVHAGQNGYIELDGIAAFNSTDATGTLEVPFANITSAIFTPLGTPAADEHIFLSMTEADGVVARSSGKVTIGRTGASKTSGLKFSFQIRGY